MMITPLFLQISFMLLTALAVYGLFRATRSYVVLAVSLAIMGVTAGLSLIGFYLSPEAIPPRLPFVILPSFMAILWLLFSAKGKLIVDNVQLSALTYIHAVRVPVEFTILALFTYGLMPESMTFEGRNFDILSGLTAPLIAYFGYVKLRLNSRILMTWNIACLVLVIQVVITGLFSAPSVIQLIDFDQPNVAVLIFPYVWLPAVIVPIVILAHVVALRDLFRTRKGTPKAGNVA
jgi:hypothetical protein